MPELSSVLPLDKITVLASFLKITWSPLPVLTSTHPFLISLEIASLEFMLSSTSLVFDHDRGDSCLL